MVELFSSILLLQRRPPPTNTISPPSLMADVQINMYVGGRVSVVRKTGMLPELESKSKLAKRGDQLGLIHLGTMMRVSSQVVLPLPEANDATMCIYMHVVKFDISRDDQGT
jgi:hypothetical protein